MKPRYRKKYVSYGFLGSITIASCLSLDYFTFEDLAIVVSSRVGGISKNSLENIIDDLVRDNYLKYDNSYYYVNESLLELHNWLDFR